MRPIKLIGTILLAADRCEIEMEVAFWYTSGEDSPDYGPVVPEIDFDQIREIFMIVTPSGVTIDERWLKERGYYDGVVKYATNLIKMKLWVGSRVWYDLVGIAEDV